MPEPPRIVFDAGGLCPDGPRARADLAAALASSHAPESGWVITVHLQRSPMRLVRVDAEIADASGRTIAQRVLTNGARDCQGAARAVGVWASLVLDAQHRAPVAGAEAKLIGSEVDAPDGGALAASVDASSEGPAEPNGGADLGSTSASPVSRASIAPVAPAAPWPVAGDVPPPPNVDAGRRPKDELRPVEIGLGAFLMGGTGADAVAGATPYVFVNVARDFFVRPSLAVGESLAPLGASANESLTWFGGRVDGCLNASGLYARNRGLQVDLCAGVELAVTHYAPVHGGDGASSAPPPSTRFADVATGPSLDLRGELGSQLVALIRGVADVNVVRGSFSEAGGGTVEVPWFSGRLEVALAWRAR